MAEIATSTRGRFFSRMKVADETLNIGIAAQSVVGDVYTQPPILNFILFLYLHNNLSNTLSSMPFFNISQR